MLLTAMVWSVSFEIGGRGGRAQASRSARVRAVNVIETVTDAELIFVAELVIDLGQEVTAVNRVGIETGGNLRTRVA